MVAHVQEPGASDNASGCATLYALARALNESIASGALPPPERTLTFIWGDEVNGSREWLRAHPDDAASVRYMFALDMTGEDTRKTGGTFLIEKQADPSAVWSRPSDPHSEWGSSDGPRGFLERQSPERPPSRRVQAPRPRYRVDRANEPLRRRQRSHRVRDSRHPVAPQLALHRPVLPHEPGPPGQGQSRLKWQNVAAAVGTSAWVLASADDRDARVVADDRRAARPRRAWRSNARRVAASSQAAPDRPQAEAIERQVLDGLDQVVRRSARHRRAICRSRRRAPRCGGIVAAARARLH